MSQPSSGFSPDMRCPSVRSISTSEVSRDEARHMFERSQKRWSQTHDQLNSAIFQRTTSPLSPIDLRQKDYEIAELRRQLAVIQAEMEQNKQQLQDAETTIRQQQATIRNQSKAIENPRSGYSAPPTPRHQSQPHSRLGAVVGTGNGRTGIYNNQHQNQQSAYNVPTGAHNKSAAPVKPQYPFSASDSFDGGSFSDSSAHHTPQSATRYRGSRINESGSPEGYDFAPPSTPSSKNAFAQQRSIFSYNNTTSLHDPFTSTQSAPAFRSLAQNDQRGQDFRHFASPDSFVTNPYPETSIPSISYVSSSAAAHEAKVRESFQKVFDMVHQYTTVHANFPSTIGDNALPKSMKDKLLNAATSTTAFGLMTDQNTRYLLISKIIIQWLIKHILKYNAFSGLDADADQIINGTKATIYQSTPAPVRFLMLKNIADQIHKIHEKREFPAYIEHLCLQRATQLLELLQPLMHQQTVGRWPDLVTLMRETYKLTELMLTGTDEFSFEFHDYGCAFSTEEMINVDPHMVRYNAVELHRMRAVVRLGATPLVRSRKNTPHGEISQSIVIKGKVLLKRYA